MRIDLPILEPACVAGFLVLAALVPLGRQVLKRGIVFIDLAIAQIAGFGVIVADALGWEARGWAMQVSALSAALLGAWLLFLAERRWPEVQEATIGVVFVLAACGGLMILAGNPHGNEHLQDLLVGQIIWVSNAEIGLMAALDVAMLALWWLLRNRFGRLGFYLVFSCIVTAAVQVVGIYLVFASLIVPALATRHLQGRKALAMAYLTGALAYVVGLLVSDQFDLPSGPVVVCALAVCGAFTFALTSHRKRIAVNESMDRQPLRESR